MFLPLLLQVKVQPVSSTVSISVDALPASGLTDCSQVQRLHTLLANMTGGGQGMGDGGEGRRQRQGAEGLDPMLGCRL